MRATTSSVPQAIPCVENIAAQTVEVTAICMDCKKSFTYTVNAPRYNRWIAGEGRIVNMLPELSIEARRLFVSGTCSYGACRP